MPKMRFLGGSDAGTNAPSGSFIYPFDTLRYWVRDDWEQVLSHTDDGTVISGSLDALLAAFEMGADMKVGIRGLCDDLVDAPIDPIDHEVFINLHAYYYYTETRQMMGATYPLVRVRPSIPLAYESKGWDFGWVMPRSDGYVALLLVDPYTLKFRRAFAHCAIRWFIR